MRIVLVQDGCFHKTHDGASKANRLVLEGLANRGHDCRAVVPSRTKYDVDSRVALIEELERKGIGCMEIAPGVDRFQVGAVTVDAVTESSSRNWVRYAGLREHLLRIVESFCPDWLLVASEDRGNVLLEASVAVSSRVVYIARSSAMLGFGPLCMIPNSAAVSHLRRTAGILACSHYLGDYIRTWAQLEATVLDMPVYGAPPFPHYRNFERGFVTLINPCLVKGLPILLGLARILSDVPFAVVPTWGTTAADLDEIEASGNIRVLPPVDDIDLILRDTRILLVPSLWDEAFGMVVVEAMLRGIPVLASDVGGLREAKLGVEFLLPVRPVTGYRNRLDERLVAIPLVPEQDLGPWETSLHRVLTSREEYARVSAESRTAAEEYVRSLDFGKLEAYLDGLESREPT